MHNLFLESLNSTIFGIRCGSLQEIEKGECMCDNNFKYMGGDYSNSVSKPYGGKTKSCDISIVESDFNLMNPFVHFSVYYLETNGWAPYQKVEEFFFEKVIVIYADPFSNNKS